MGAGTPCLSHFDSAGYASRESWSQRLKHTPVRIQWDPERSIRLGVLPYRSLQIGLSGEAIDRYVDEWVVGLTDLTGSARAIHDLLRDGDEPAAKALLPAECAYPLPAHLATIIGASPA